MRRKDREVTQKEELQEIIKCCKVVRLGLQDEEGIYIVPLNFGYQYEDNQLVFYFHSAKEGRKIDAIAVNPKVCIEMDCEHQLVEAETACAYGYSFLSIIGNGTAHFVTDREEKKMALSLLMRHQTGKEFAFTDEMTEAVCVFKVLVTSFTGKNRPMR